MPHCCIPSWACDSALLHVRCRRGPCSAAHVSTLGSCPRMRCRQIAEDMEDIENALKDVQAGQAAQLATLMEMSVLMQRVLAGEDDKQQRGVQTSAGDPAELPSTPLSVALAKPGPNCSSCWIVDWRSCVLLAGQLGRDRE